MAESSQVAKFVLPYCGGVTQPSPHESLKGWAFDLLVWEACGCTLQWELRLVIELAG